MKKILLLVCLLVACDAESPTKPRASATPGAVLRSIPESKPTSAIETEQLLTAGNSGIWQLLQRFRDDVDITTDCLRDDALIVHTQHRLDLNVGNDLCPVEGSIERSRSGNWLMTTSFDLLVTMTDDLPFQLKIHVLDAQRLLISYRDTDGTEIVEVYQRLQESPVSAAPSAPTATTKPGLFP